MQLTAEPATLVDVAHQLASIHAVFWILNTTVHEQILRYRNVHSKAKMSTHAKLHFL